MTVDGLGVARPTPFVSILHSLWWAVSTITTVGYGDMIPVTACGQTLAGVREYAAPASTQPMETAR